MDEKFICDVHLGRLAKYLRMLGFDTLYSNQSDASKLIEVSNKDSRHLLSRDASFPTKSIYAVTIHSEGPVEQLKQVLAYYQLKEKIRPFSRCMVCNGILNQVPKEMVLSKLQPNTIQYVQQLWQCSHCGRIYWKGSHYERMRNLIASL